MTSVAIGQQSNKHAEPGHGRRPMVSSGPWRFLPPSHTGRFLPVPRSSPAFLPFPAVLSALPALLWAQLSRDRSGAVSPARGSPGGSRHSRQPPPERPDSSGHGASAAGLHRAMEPAGTMAQLIRTSAEGKGHGPHGGSGGEGARGGAGEALRGHRPVTAAAGARPGDSALCPAGAGPEPLARFRSPPDNRGSPPVAPRPGRALPSPGAGPNSAAPARPEHLGTARNRVLTRG